MKVKHCFILLAILFVVIPAVYYAKHSVDVESTNQKVIEWYIENGKEPYNQYANYEEYMEDNEK